eukprot:SAG11_NODE_29221_length_313_cov_0.883178_1_plen_40_part_01
MIAAVRAARDEAAAKLSPTAERHKSRGEGGGADACMPGRC